MSGPIAPDYFALQSDNSDGVLHETRWYKSQDQWSGHGKEWSPWYRVSSGPPPKGMRVASATFVLDGGRHCIGNEIDRSPGCSWCECRQVEFTSEIVTWAFRMHRLRRD